MELAASISPSPLHDPSSPSLDTRFTVAFGSALRLSILGALERGGELGYREIAILLSERPRRIRGELLILEQFGFVARVSGRSSYVARTDDLWTWLTALREQAIPGEHRARESPIRP